MVSNAFCKFIKLKKQTNQIGNVFFNKNVFDLDQKHFEVLEMFCKLKNTMKTSGET